MNTRAAVCIVVFGIKLPGTLADYCVPVSKVPGLQHLLSDLDNCQFRKLTVALLRIRIFCRCANSLEFTAGSSAGSRCWLWTI